MTLLETLTLVFAGSATGLFLSDLLGQPPVPAFLVSGLALSPFIDPVSVKSLTVIGAGFLVFSFGVRMTPERVLEGSESWSAALAQVAVTGVLGGAAALFLGLSSLESLLVAAAASFASSATGMNLIQEQKSIGLLFSQEAESIQFIQDLAGGLFLAVSSVLVSGRLGEGIAGVLAMGVGALALRPIFRRLASEVEDSRELLMMVSLGYLSVFALGSSLAGVSPVVGALAAGISAAVYPHNIEVLEVVDSLKDFFSAVFFVSLGLLVDISAGGFRLAALVFVLTSVVGPVVAASMLYRRLDLRTSVLSGFSLDRVSEVVLVAAIQLSLAAAVSARVFNGVVLGSAATYALSSYTGLYRDKIYDALSRFRSESAEPLELEGHVIVVGHDEQGRQLVKELDEKVVVVENNPERAEEAAAEKILLGNALEDSTWRRANSSEASVVVSTTPSRAVSEKILELETNARKVPRASTPVEAAEYLERGVWTVNFPEAIASEELLDHIEGSLHSRDYLERLRRNRLTELRRYLWE